MSAGPSVLLVADSAAAAERYAGWLRGDCVVRTADTAAAALASLDERVHVVVLDRRCSRITGDAVVTRVRRRGLRCSVAVVTATDPDVDLVETGFDAYLSAPVDRTEFRATVERLAARSDYGHRIDEYARLAAEKARIETRTAPTERRSNPTAEALDARIEGVSESADALAQGFNRNDVAAVLRDIAPPVKVKL